MNPTYAAMQSSIDLSRQANPSAFEQGEEMEYVDAIKSGVQLSPDQLAAAAKYGIYAAPAQSSTMSTTTKVLLVGGAALLIMMFLRNR